MLRYTTLFSDLPGKSKFGCIYIPALKNYLSQSKQIKYMHIYIYVQTHVQFSYLSGKMICGINNLAIFLPGNKY